MCERIFLKMLSRLSSKLFEKKKTKEKETQHLSLLAIAMSPIVVPGDRALCEGTSL